MENNLSENLNSFRGWILVFLLMHAPIALYNLTGGLTLAGNLIRSGASWWFVALNILLSLLLPACLLLLLKRKAAFRWVYIGYAALMSANFLMQQGVHALSVIVALACTVPWVLYLFRSRRVAAILARSSRIEG